MSRNRQPTRRQRQALQAVCDTGSIKAAAVALHKSESAVRRLLVRCYESLDVEGIAPAAYWLGRENEMGRKRHIHPPP